MAMTGLKRMALKMSPSMGHFAKGYAVRSFMSDNTANNKLRKIHIAGGEYLPRNEVGYNLLAGEKYMVYFNPEIMKFDIDYQQYHNDETTCALMLDGQMCRARFSKTDDFDTHVKVVHNGEVVLPIADLVERLDKLLEIVEEKPHAEK